MKNLTRQNTEQLFVAQELINKVKSKCCGIKGNFIVTFQEKGGKKWEYDEFFFQNQENAGETGSIAALRELSQPDQERQSIFLENKVNDFST